VNDTKVETLDLSDDEGSIKQTIEQCMSDDSCDDQKGHTPNFSLNSEDSDCVERLSISDSCAASFSSSNESLPNCS